MSFYTALEDIKAVLSIRQELRKEVEGWWNSAGLEFPTQFSDCGLLGREPIVRVEFFKFYEMCAEIEIQPACISARDELFISSKPKMSLAHPMIFEGFSKKGFPITKKEKLINVNEHNGKSTLAEAGVISFHQVRMKRICPNLLVWDMSKDMSKWKEINLYYQGYLSLCVAHGVLFEDYHGIGESKKCLSNFTERVFEPAFEWLENKFGTGPIVTPLPWKTSYNLHPDDEILKQMNSNGKKINLNPIKALL